MSGQKKIEWKVIQGERNTRGIKKHEIASKTGLECYVGLLRGQKARSGNEDRRGDREAGPYMVWHWQQGANEGL